MNSWAEKKCLTALMKLKGVKDGEWFSLNGHEYVVRAGELYTRAPEPAPMCIGMILEDDSAINQYTFTPQKGDFYHYLVLNGDAGQIETRHTVYQGDKMDEQNTRMHNCFKTMLDAVKYKTLMRRALEK